jgi:hypothetical protein
VEVCSVVGIRRSADHASLRQAMASGDEVRLRRIVDRSKRVRLTVSRRAIQIYSSNWREVVASLRLLSRLANLSASGTAPTVGGSARLPCTPHGRARGGLSRAPDPGPRAAACGGPARQVSDRAVSAVCRLARRDARMLRGGPHPRLGYASPPRPLVRHFVRNGRRLSAHAARRTALRRRPS